MGRDNYKKLKEKILKYIGNGDVIKESNENHNTIIEEWNRIKLEEMKDRLLELEKNQKSERIKLDKDNGSYRRSLISFIIIILLISNSIATQSLLWIVLAICNEILLAPIRVMIDYTFNSYDRIVGICTSTEESWYRYKNDASGGQIITVCYDKGEKYKKFAVDAPTTIRKDHCISIVLGKFSNRVIGVETHDCRIRIF